MNRICLCVVLWALSTIASSAPITQSTVAPTATSAAQPLPPLPDGRPDVMIRDGIKRLGEFLSQGGGLSPDKIRGYLDSDVATYFDFEAMGRWAAGPFYRRMTEPQRTQFADKLRALFLDSLAKNLGTYGSPLPKTQVYPIRSAPGGGPVTVRARVMPDQAYPVNVDFRFAPKDGAWKVYDVAANGYSAVAFYRHHFATQARREGIAAFYD
ncbi:MAG: ABC transporter substrate-binding protein [Pseudomonadota bacterium]